MTEGWTADTRVNLALPRLLSAATWAEALEPRFDGRGLRLVIDAAAGRYGRYGRYGHDGSDAGFETRGLADECNVDETLNALARSTGFEAIVVGVDNGGDKRMTERSPVTNPQVGAATGLLAATAVAC